MTSDQITSLPQRAQRLIQQDPRKAGVLAALLLILAVMVARHVLSRDDVPLSVAHAAHTGLSLNGIGASSTAGGKTGNTAGAAAASPVLAWLEGPAVPLVRNPFGIRFEIFPPEVTRSAEAGESRGFWDEVAKSLTDQVDQQEKKQEVLQAVQARASGLQVTSIIMGPAPRAIVDDKLVGEGDVVANFRVLKIEARRIIVESEGIRLEIQMK